ncbi:hypothetical protein ACFL1M_01790 [Patescibacteria group bacterium]
MFNLKKPTLSEKIAKESKKIEPELRELIIGRKTLISLLGFSIGGVLIGSAAYDLLSKSFGIIITVFLGALLFIISGIVSDSFKK